MASPLLVVGFALLIAGVLGLFGADCVTHAKYAMALDNKTVCNELGDVRLLVGWAALVLVLVFTPVAFVTGVAGGWRALKRRGR